MYFIKAVPVELILILGYSDLFISKSYANRTYPTVYEYFEGNRPVTGLVAKDKKFWLNGKELRIVSGAMYYFRIHPSVWRDRMKKLRALGANTLETYVPWNLHEPRENEFDFGYGDNDFSALLDIRRYIAMAKEEDLLVLLRPGPYICSEWDFGGLPSWLQRDPNMKVRTAYKPYLDRVKIYFNMLLPLVSNLQFTLGGPIIGFQIENEYASFSPRNSTYLETIKQIFDDNGLRGSLYYTSDNLPTDVGGLPGIYKAVNFNTNPEEMFNALLSFQPDKPLMAMEYWSGWFDHWFQPHNTVVPNQFAKTLETIFKTYSASVNLYMFHGGTSFGFMAGANNLATKPFYLSDVTSYDYDSPLSEAGDYTEKYHLARALIETYQIPKLHRPELIPESAKYAYPTLKLQYYLSYEDILSQVPSSAKFVYQKPISMEKLPMNGIHGNYSGQSYGYILYRIKVHISEETKYKAGPVKDFGVLIVDGKIQKTDYWINSEKEIPLRVDPNEMHTIDLLVECMARVNFGTENDFLQQKGLPDGSIKLNGEEVSDIQVIALEMKSKWIKSLVNWKYVGELRPQAPVMFKSQFEIVNEPADTFLDMSTWHKGIVFINGFNLGRYFRVGPQQTLYIPAELLKSGTNTITIFEQLEPGSKIIFRSTPILNVNQNDS